MDKQTDDQSLLGKQKQIACLISLFLVVMVIGADAIMAGLLRTVAFRIQHRLHPLIPPALSLLFGFYFLDFVSLIGCFLWTRSRGVEAAQFAPQEFVRQIQILLTIGSAGLYLACVWVFLGGAWLQSIPLLVGQAVVSLLCSLPLVMRYNADGTNRGQGT